MALIEFENVSKIYGSTKANDALNFAVEAGTIHALIGENGAGKSTAMKLLFGLEEPSSGTVKLAGKPVRWQSPRDAMTAGIGMVHQHFMLSAVHTALDNVLLGREPTWSGMNWLPSPLRGIDRAKILRELNVLCREVGFVVDWTKPAGALPVGIQQQLEILKLLHAGVKIMIFDEPTAVLSPQETDRFLGMLRTLKTQGKTVIVITHKLREVQEIADRVTVMRAGRTVATVEGPSTSIQELADLMVGRHVELAVKEPVATRMERIVLSLEKLSLRTSGDRQVLCDLTLSVRAGQIVGIAGVEGNGQSELLHLLYNPRRFYRAKRWQAQGALHILGEDARAWHGSDVRSRSIGIVPADRHHEAILLRENLLENDILGHELEFTKVGMLCRGRVRTHVQKALFDYDVRPQDPMATIGSLSGGNQQKFVMARELGRKPELLLCAQPTRGVDVGSIEQIHGEIQKCRAAGMGILLVSSQLDELMQLSDVLHVMFEGRIAATFHRGAFDEQAIGLAMGGCHD